MFSLAENGEKWTRFVEVLIPHSSGMSVRNYAKDTNDSYARDFIGEMALKQKSRFDIMRHRVTCSSSSEAGHGLLRQISARDARTPGSCSCPGVLVLEPTIDRQTGTLRIHIDAQGCFVGDEGPFIGVVMAILAKKGALSQVIS